MGRLVRDITAPATEPAKCGKERRRGDTSGRGNIIGQTKCSRRRGIVESNAEGSGETPTSGANARSVVEGRERDKGRGTLLKTATERGMVESRGERRC